MYSLVIKAEYVTGVSEMEFLEISREARDVKLYLMACPITFNLCPVSTSDLVSSNLHRYF